MQRPRKSAERLRFHPSLETLERRECFAAGLSVTTAVQFQSSIRWEAIRFPFRAW